jgi:RNA polymerase sigma-70 factor (ECF subfamily)
MASGSIDSRAPGEELLARARKGDDEAYRRLVDPHRAELHAHCYRMLGSFHDAEDALQDTLLRAWRGLSRFKAGRPLRPWLYRIATNACFDVIARRPHRVLPMEYGLPPNVQAEEVDRPVTAPVWIEPYPDGEERYE